ncbi:MAG: 2-methylcitrate dehydratase PrpD [Gammaproteobacteria bacterium]
MLFCGICFLLFGDYPMPASSYARFAVAMAAAPLSGEVLHAARRCLIDWYAASLPGSVLAPATLLREALRDELGSGSAQGRSRLLPDGLVASTRAAALINGVASHTVEFDDIYSVGLYHPGSPVIAAALALAERERASGETLLRAIIAGYEVSNRIAAAVNPAHYSCWHTTGTVGCFGAAIAAGCVLELDQAQMKHALNGVASMAAGLQQAFRTDAMTKPLHAGRAAESGVLAALAAKYGVTGAEQMLDGERGFGKAMSKDVNWDDAVQGLGEQWTIVNTTQKNHGCCGHTFAAIDAVIELRNAHKLSSHDIESIHVGTYATALEICADYSPKTGYEGKFSLPYCAAVGLIDARVRLDAFDEAHLHDGEIRELMSKVELAVDEQCQQVFPGQRSARVTIRTHDGRELKYHAKDRKGDPQAPLSDAEIVDKYRELAAPVLGQGQAEMLLDALWRVDVLDHVDELPVTSAQVLSATGD